MPPAETTGRIGVEIAVRGRVQGVAYRWTTLNQAERLGIDGWVGNEPDGSVVGYFEGPREAVEALVAWCRKGPSGARVEGLDTAEVAARGVHGFDVRQGG